jgi:hypothetical protein
MKGFELYNGNQDFRVLDGARTVLTTQGTLINLLPPAYDVGLTFNIVFPDFSKDYLYGWKHRFDYTSLGNAVGYDSFCNTQLTIPAQNFVDEINLIAAPTSSDIFVGSIVLNRISAPSHTWAGTSIDPLQPMGVKIPFVSGSVLTEAEFGMVRAFSIYVSGGQLKLHRQQSVSTPPEGWGLFGQQYNWNAPSSGGGGENVNGGAAGIPVLQVDTQNVESTSVSPATSTFAPIYDQRTRRGFANACAIPNPANYNYGSTYQAILTGAFGRRS